MRGVYIPVGNAPLVAVGHLLLVVLQVLQAGVRDVEVPGGLGHVLRDVRVAVDRAVVHPAFIAPREGVREIGTVSLNRN